MIYFDTSALAKNYIWEDGSLTVGKLLLENDEKTTSKLTYPEMLSALARRTKNGDLSKLKMKEVINQFVEDWKRLLIVDLHDDLFPIVKKVVGQYHLRAADSIHLASAIWLKTTLKEHIIFISSDLNLLRAAQSQRLSPMNPQGH